MIECAASRCIIHLGMVPDVPSAGPSVRVSSIPPTNRRTPKQSSPEFRIVCLISPTDLRFNAGWFGMLRRARRVHVRRGLFATLAVLFISAAALTSAGNTSANHIQNFAVNARICYGAALPVGVLACPGSTETTAPASSAATEYVTLDFPHGSRLGDCGPGRKMDGSFACGRLLATTYTPNSFGFTPGAPLSVVGDVTLALDLFCDGIDDVVSGGPADPVGASGGEFPGWPWPDSVVWRPFPVTHMGVAPPSWLSAYKQTPTTFTPVSHDMALLWTVWIGKYVPLYLPTLQDTLPQELHVLTEVSPYAPVRVTQVWEGNPIIADASNGVLLCEQSKAAVVLANSQLTTPAAAGYYPRFTLMTSHPDIRGGTVTRRFDRQCVVIGSPGPDADNDCMLDGSGGDIAGADSDFDGLRDGYEALVGTNPAMADTDADGSSDFTEMFLFTRPVEGGVGFLADCDGAGPNTSNNADDTDCDGSLDKQDTGKDEVAGGAYNDTTVDDNCPAFANLTQDNLDRSNIWNGTASDATNPATDRFGDACDVDDDNDGLRDVTEVSLWITNSAPHCHATFVTGAVFNPTNPLMARSDGESTSDGAECRFGGNPVVANVNPIPAPVDNLPDGAGETMCRTQQISVPTGGLNNNPDGDSFATGDADSDSDNDFLLDGRECKRGMTNQANADVDGDGCSDGMETATVNGDRSVNATDLSQVAQRFGSYTFPDGTIDEAKMTYDYTADGTINALDLSQVAQRFGACPSEVALIDEEVDV